MCILGLHLSTGAGGGLLLAHTRDEALQRATAPPRLDASGVLCARDALGGGTWLGVHRGSRLLVALTNVRRRRADASTGAGAGAGAGWASRGQLVLELLRGGAARLDELRAAARAGGAALELGRAFGPCNLVVARLGGGAEGEEDEAFFLTNDHGDGGGAAPLSRASVSRLGAGAHAVSNSGLDDESWRKVAFVRAAFAAARVPAAAPAAASALERRALVAAALAQVVPAMSREAPLPDGDGGADLAWSPLPHALEALLQAHVRVPRQPPPVSYGSRSLTCVLRPGGGAEAWFCHASFDGDGEGNGEGVAASAKAGEAEADDGAECDLVVEGIRFRVWRF